MASFDRADFQREIRKFPPAAIAVIAARLAMRVLPMLASSKNSEMGPFWYWSGPAYKARSVLSVLRACQTAACVTTGVVYNEYNSNASANAVDAAVAATNAGDGAAAGNSAGAAHAAAFAAHAAANAAGNGAENAISATVSAYANAYSAYAGENATDSALEGDLAVFRSSGLSETSGLGSMRIAPATMERPLWTEGMPEEITARWRQFQSDALSLNAGFEVWLNWYRDRLEGKPFDREMEAKWAGLSKERLTQTPAEINAYLKSLLDGLA